MSRNSIKASLSTRLNTDLLKEFRVYCVVNNLYQNEVIEKLIEGLLKDEVVPEQTFAKTNIYTTTLEQDLLNGFKEFCKEKGVYQNDVLNGLIYQLLAKEGEGYVNTD